MYLIHGFHQLYGLFLTLDWPEESYELKRFYPGNVLVTGFDIIFLLGRKNDDDGFIFYEKNSF